MKEEVTKAVEERKFFYEKEYLNLEFSQLCELKKLSVGKSSKEFRKNLLQFGNAKKEVMLISCLNKTALLSTQLYSNEPPVEIQERISWVLSSLLLYCAEFNINFKEVYKYCELERKTFAHIEIKPVPFTFYLVREITDIKFNVWAAHHMGESVGKCFILAQHYKINLYEATKQLLTDLNE